MMTTNQSYDDAHNPVKGLKRVVMASMTNAELLIELIKRNGGTQKAPANIRNYDDCQECVVEIDADHTATLLIYDDFFLDKD